MGTGGFGPSPWLAHADCFCHPSVLEWFVGLKPGPSVFLPMSVKRLSRLSETLPPQPSSSTYTEKPSHLSSVLSQFAASPSPAEKEEACSSKAVSFPWLTDHTFSNSASLHETPSYLGIITELLPSWVVGGFGEIMPGKRPACLHCTRDTSCHCFFLGTTHLASGCSPSWLPFPVLSINTAH